MKMMMKIAGATAFLLLLGFCETANAAATHYYTPNQAALARLYTDPQTLPPKVTYGRIETFDEGNCLHLQYRGADGSAVSALLFVPVHAGVKHPAPCLLLLQGLGLGKEAMLPFARFFATGGYASFMLDDSGEPVTASNSMAALPNWSSEDQMAGYLVSHSVASVLNLRRGLDWLCLREDIDHRRIAVVGFSLGSMIGTILTSVDHRICAAVLVSSGGDLAQILVDEARGGVAFGRYYAKLIESVDSNTLAEQLTTIDPINYVASIAPRPVLMTHGTADRVIAPNSATSLYQAARQPKQLVWFDGWGHFPPLWQLYPLIDNFLGKYLPVDRRPYHGEAAANKASFFR